MLFKEEANWKSLGDKSMKVVEKYQHRKREGCYQVCSADGNVEVHRENVEKLVILFMKIVERLSQEGNAYLLRHYAKKDDRGRMLWNCAVEKVELH